MLKKDCKEIVVYDKNRFDILFDKIFDVLYFIMIDVGFIYLFLQHVKLFKLSIVNYVDYHNLVVLVMLIIFALGELLYLYLFRFFVFVSGFLFLKLSDKFHKKVGDTND